jgi:precorrin-2 dehydrogenase / sirohydrochlorin ferrochelatase
VSRTQVYPVGLVVSGRRCLVVGGGPVAARKIRSLLQCGAAVTVVAPEVHRAMAVLAADGTIAAIGDNPLDVQLRPYRRGEAARFRLVITATGDPDVDAQVHADAEEAGVWVNSADDPAHCTVILPAVYRQGPVTVAVSTDGTSPALAGWLRDRVAAAVGPEVATLAELVAEARAAVRARGDSTEVVDWRALLDGPLPDLVRAGRLAEARDLLAGAIGAAPGPNGRRPDGGSGNAPPDAGP